MIKDPIDLKTIAMKIQEGEYSSLDELEDDFAKLVRNAQTFNEPGSQVWSLTQYLQRMFFLFFFNTPLSSTQYQDSVSFLSVGEQW